MNSGSEPTVHPDNDRASVSVLVIDDDLEVLETTAALLRTMGYIVRTASSGQEVLDRYAAHLDAYDLIMSDVRMPGMNGFELAEVLHARSSSVRIVLMSGESVRTHGRHGIDEVLAKPFSRTQLEDALLNRLAIV